MYLCPNTLTTLYDVIMAEHQAVPGCYVMHVCLGCIWQTLITHSLQHKEHQNFSHKTLILQLAIYYISNHGLKCHTQFLLLKLETSARYNFILFKEVRKKRERESYSLKCRRQLDGRKPTLLACRKPWEQKREHPSGCRWIELPLGSQGKQASLLSLCCSTRYIIRISPPSYPTVHAD